MMTVLKAGTAAITTRIHITALATTAAVTGGIMRIQAGEVAEITSHAAAAGAGTIRDLKNFMAAMSAVSVNFPMKTPIMATKAGTATPTGETNETENSNIISEKYPVPAQGRGFYLCIYATKRRLSIIKPEWHFFSK